MYFERLTRYSEFRVKKVIKMCHPILLATSSSRGRTLLKIDSFSTMSEKIDILRPSMDRKIVQ